MPAPTSRDDHQRRFTGVTVEQLVHDLEFATSAAEVDAVGFVSLVLFGHDGCRRPLPPREGRVTLHSHLAYHRRRVSGRISRVDVVLDGIRPEVLAARRTQRREARMVRDDQIRRLGLDHVQPNPRGAHQ